MPSTERHSGYHPQMVCLRLKGILVTAHKRSLGEGNLFTFSVCSQGGGVVGGGVVPIPQCIAKPSHNVVRYPPLPSPRKLVPHPIPLPPPGSWYPAPYPPRKLVPHPIHLPPPYPRPAQYPLTPYPAPPPCPISHPAPRPIPCPISPALPCTPCPISRPPPP